MTLSSHAATDPEETQMFPHKHPLHTTRPTARASVAALITTALAIATGGPASAGPVERWSFEESESFEFPLCGIATQVDLTESGTVQTVRRGRNGDLYVSAHVHGEVTNTNLATGRSVHLVRDGFDHDVRIVRGDDDLLTIRVLSVIHERDYNADGSLAFVTTGQLPITVVVDTKGTDDLEDDDVLAEEFGDFRGRNDRAAVDFCAWYTEQTA